MLASKGNDINKLFQALGWQKLNHYRVVAPSIMMNKNLQKWLPNIEYLISWFVFQNNSVFLPIEEFKTQIGSSTAQIN